MTKAQAALSHRFYPAQPGTNVYCANGIRSPYIRGGLGTQGCRVLNSNQENVALDPFADLVLATAGGDKEAFARLYSESSGRLMAIALRMVGRRDLAEDILQEAYVAIWRKAKQFDHTRGRAFTWLAAIVRYRAIDRLRADNRETRDAVFLDDSDSELPEFADADQPLDVPEAMAVRDCLGRLQKDQRKAIALAYYHGFTHEELAERLETPLGTVKSWVRRGLLQLRNCLEQ